MNQQQLDAIKARAGKATPGPWVYLFDDDSGTGSIHQVGDEFWIEETPANADFIANARQDIPDLVAEVERLRAEVEQLSTAAGDVLAAYNDAEGLDDFGGAMERLIEALAKVRGGNCDN